MLLRGRLGEEKETNKNKRSRKQKEKKERKKRVTNRKKKPSFACMKYSLLLLACDVGAVTSQRVCNGLL